MPVAFPDAPRWIGQAGLIVAAILVFVAIGLFGHEHAWWNRLPRWFSQHIGWRFRLLPPSNGAIAFRPNVTQSAPSDFPSGLYVGQIRLTANHLDDGYLELAIRGFNGTDVPISVADVTGNIRLENAVAERPDELVALPRPVLLTDRTATKGIGPRAEIFLLLHQFLDRRLAAIVAQQIEGKGACFNLEDFKVEMANVSDPNERAPLPFWSAIVVRRDEWVRSNRIIRGELRALG
jgi:hypothetical protein